MRRIALVFVVLFVSAAIATVVFAGPIDPSLLENHYLTYFLSEPDTVFFADGVSLHDQFSTYTTQLLVREKLANPTDKNGEGMFDPFLHQTWWHMDTGGGTGGALVPETQIGG